MNKWVTKQTTAEDLDETLESTPDGWGVFAILPYGNQFIVVFKRE